MGGRAALPTPLHSQAQGCVDTAINHVDHFSVSTVPTLVHPHDTRIDHAISAPQSHGGFAPIYLKQ